MTNMSSTTAPNKIKSSPVKELSNYAVIKLRMSDNLISLFQLLLQNGYTQVSFVNSLNQTIFPFIEHLEKGTQTAAHFFDPYAGALNGGSQALMASQALMDAHSYEKSAAALTNAALLLDKSAQSLGLDFIPAQTLAHLLPLTTSLSGAHAQTAGFLGLPTMPSIFSTSSMGNGANGAGQIFSHKLLNDSILNHYNNSSLSHHSAKDAILSNMNGNAGGKRKLDMTNGLSPHADLHSVSNGVSALHFKKNSPYGNQQQQNCVVDPMMGAAAVATAAPPSAGGVVSTATNTQLRQRGQRGYADDPSLYVTCRLCKNRIMGSRVSNLTNHVRRHSSLKQFQCCYCEYTHNEMAKVRLHMLHNHKDKDSQPIDNLSPEMQSSWEYLMKECFPDHHHNGGPVNNHLSLLAHGSRSNGKMWKSDEISMVVRRGDLQNHPTSRTHPGTLLESPQSTNTAASDPKEANNLDSGASDCALPTEQSSPGDTQQNNQQSDALAITTGALYPGGFPCLECSEVVQSKDLLFHVYTRHLSCVPVFFCSVCGLGDSDHEKLKNHLVSEHPLSAGDAQIYMRDIEYIVEHYLPQFFSCNGSSATSSSMTSSSLDGGHLRHRRGSPPSSECSDVGLKSGPSKIENGQRHHHDDVDDVIGVCAAEKLRSTNGGRQHDDDSDVICDAAKKSDGSLTIGREDDVVEVEKFKLTNGRCGDDGVIDSAEPARSNVESNGATHSNGAMEGVCANGGIAGVHAGNNRGDSDHPIPAAATNGSCQHFPGSHRSNGVSSPTRAPSETDADPKTAGKDGANAADYAKARDMQHHCPKCHYATHSRRRIINHVNLRHNNTSDN